MISFFNRFLPAASSIRGGALVEIVMNLMSYRDIRRLQGLERDRLTIRRFLKGLKITSKTDSKTRIIKDIVYNAGDHVFEKDGNNLTVAVCSSLASLDCC
jgi:hypothetical protein